MIINDINNENDIATFHYEAEVLVVNYKADIEITLDRAKQYLIARKKYQKEDKVKLIADVSKVLDVSKEARAFFSSKNFSELNIAMALITNSLQGKIFANFFMRLNKPANPTKMFQSKAKALKWLRTFQ